MKFITLLTLTLFFSSHSTECYSQLYDHYIEKTLQYISEGDREKAVFYANKAINTDSTKARAYYLLGSAYSTDGRLEESLEVLEKAESLEDSEIQVYYMLGHVHDQLGHFQISFEYYSKYIDVDSTNLFVLTRKAHIACKIEKYDEAKAILDYVLSIEPQRIAALNIYGLYHEWQKEYEKAIVYFTRIIELDETNATAYYNRCRNHAFLENMDENCSDCQKASMMGIPDAEFFILDNKKCK